VIRLAKLQFLGPAALLITVGAAEGAAFALAQDPTSEALWYMNLKVFGIFQNTYYLLKPSLNFPYAQFFLIALPLFTVASYGLISKRTFPLALASHLSFVYAAFLLYVGAMSQPNSLSTSLSDIGASTGPNFYLPLVLLGASLVSFIGSHLQYLLAFFHIYRTPMRRS
jgi:hypothetical protein